MTEPCELCTGSQSGREKGLVLHGWLQEPQATTDPWFGFLLQLGSEAGPGWDSGTPESQPCAPH